MNHKKNTNLLTSEYMCVMKYKECEPRNKYPWTILLYLEFHGNLKKWCIWLIGLIFDPRSKQQSQNTFFFSPLHPPYYNPTRIKDNFSPR